MSLRPSSSMDLLRQGSRTDDRFREAGGMVSMTKVVRRAQALVVAYSLLVVLPRGAPGGMGWLEMHGEATLCRSRETKEALCARGPLEISLLVCARASAYLMLVSIAAVFVTKARLFWGRYNKTILSMVVPAYDLHDLHVRAGWELVTSGAAHAAAHAARHLLRHEGARHLRGTRVAVSGWVALASLLPVALLQTERCRALARFEVRKPAHVVGALAFAAACVVHGPLALPIVTCVVYALYVLDATYATFWQTWRVEHSEFVRLGRGVELTFKVPEKLWPDSEGYVNVLVPWISRWEFHPFSAYSSVERPGYASIFALDAGDWTAALHASIARDTKRPVWIQGPFPSPFGERAAEFDYMVLVATGIGITPALSCIRKFASTGRTIVLIWCCRDPSIIAFYRHRLALPYLTLIYYTGKEIIKVDGLPSHVRVLDTRPDLQAVVPDVIRCVEHHVALPDHIYRRAADFLIDMNDAYLGLSELSAGAARLRFDAFVAAILRRGRSPAELVDHFLEYVQSNELTEHPSWSSRSQGPGIDLAMLWPVGVNRLTPRRRKHDVFLEMASPPDAKLKVGDGDDDDDEPDLLDNKVITAAVFARAFAALATDVLTLSEDDVYDILQSISPTGDTAISPNDLLHALELKLNHLDYSRTKLPKPRQEMRSKRANSAPPRHSHFSINAQPSARDEEDPADDVVLEADTLAFSDGRWGILYCGGVPQVQRTLQSISTELGIPLAIDKFNW